MKYVRFNLSKIIRRILKYILKLFNTLFYFVYYKNSFILVNGWVEQWFGYVQHRNFGDELNIYLIEGLTNKKVVIKNNTLFNRECFCIIGSIVEDYSFSSYVWGSGAIEGGKRELKGVPKQVLAVRGKLTQKYLQDQGICCPNVYGDPALLLPYLYNPNVEKKYKFGLIPHYSQLEDPIIIDFVSKYKNEISLISFKEYGDWHNVIKKIKSCDIIISSSLHGLIISDAYGIPNVWCKVTELIGDEFKFKDYFSGVSRKYYPPYLLNRETTLEEIIKLSTMYKPITPNMEKLIQTTPFKFKITIE